jgi:hypothetical protein
MVHFSHLASAFSALPAAARTRVLAEVPKTGLKPSDENTLGKMSSDF